MAAAQVQAPLGDLARRVVLLTLIVNNATVLNSQSATRSCCCPRIVGDQDNRLPFPIKLFQIIHHLGSGFRIQITGGLVRQNDLRIVGQHASQGDSLLLTDTQF